MKGRIGVGLIALVAFAAVGCGGNSAGHDESSEPIATTTPAVASTPTASAGSTPTPSASAVRAWSTSGGSVIRSLDGGATWDVALSNEGLHTTDFADRSVGWAIGGLRDSRLIFRSEDGGSSWIDQSGNAGVFQSFNDIVALSETHAVIVGSLSAQVGTGGAVVLRTVDAGASWSIARIQGTSAVARSSLRSACATDDGIVFACGAGRIHVVCILSTDGGAGFVEISDRVTALQVECSGATTLWALGSGKLLRSEDGGGRFVDIGSALPADFRGAVISLAFADAEVGWLTGVEGGVPTILRTDDGGDSWRYQVLPGDVQGRLTSMASADRDNAVAVGQTASGGALGFATRNGGEAWVPAVFQADLPGLSSAAAAR